MDAAAAAVELAWCAGPSAPLLLWWRFVEGEGEGGAVEVMGDGPVPEDAAKGGDSTGIVHHEERERRRSIWG